MSAILPLFYPKVGGDVPIGDYYSVITPIQCVRQSPPDEVIKSEGTVPVGEINNDFPTSRSDL